MTKYEIKNAMLNNLKAQKDTLKLLKACAKAGNYDSVKYYNDKINALDKEFNELYAQYETAADEEANCNA